MNQAPTREKSNPYIQKQNQYKKSFIQLKGGLDESSPYIRKIKSPKNHLQDTKIDMMNQAPTKEGPVYRKNKKPFSLFI